MAWKNEHNGVLCASDLRVEKRTSIPGVFLIIERRAAFRTRADRSTGMMAD